MRQLKLITESSFNVKLIEEGEENKDLFIEGLFSSAEKLNNNGRIYRKTTLDREVKRLQEQIENNVPLYGELGHPTSPEPNLDRVAIRTVKLWWENESDVFGKAKVIQDTPMGQIAKALIKEGPIGISSRGLGTVGENGYVNDDQDSPYNLLTWDLVSSPSTIGAWVNGIYEGQTFVLPSPPQSEADVTKEIELLREEYYKQLKSFLKEEEIEYSFYKLPSEERGKYYDLKGKIDEAIGHFSDVDPKMTNMLRTLKDHILRCLRNPQ